MEEFIENKKKILKIDNPVTLFTRLLSIGGENVRQQGNKETGLTIDNCTVEDRKMAKFKYVDGDK